VSGQPRAAAWRKTRATAARLLAAATLFAAAWSGGAAHAAASDQNVTTDLSNKSCLSCHGDKQKKVEVADAKGEKRALRQVDAGKFGGSVHSQMECIACHREINDSATPHRKSAGEKRPDCAQCHVEVAKTLSTYKTAGERRGLRLVAEIIEVYKDSSHARPGKDDPDQVNATCHGCHNVHEFNVPPPTSPARAQWRLGVSDLCGRCHDSHLEEWSASVHGKAVKEKKDPKSANCADCHTAHDVGKPRSSEVKLAITASCGDCHEAAYKSYRATYHGQIATLGYAYTAKCFDCHSSHDIQPSTDPESRMHVDNRLQACQKCHSGKGDIPKATAGFVSFSPHGTTDDFQRYPQIWVANQIMINLLLGTFGFFWLHTILWFYREYRERRRRASQPHIRFEGVPEVPAALHGRHFRRFTRTWRIAHLLFAVSLMILTLTGISLFYPEAPWARSLIRMLGGPQTAGIIHRTNAVIFAGVFFWHLAYVGAWLVRNWKEFRIFGPNSLIPGPQDFIDIYAMFKWFLGFGPRPKFDRWTYWEKFDYWAPFWGVTIIGVSGVMLWAPHVIAQVLPGWVFNVATIFHGEEAFLAAVFLFTVHFFNNHFRPDKFPLDVVMFTGSVPVEEFAREHALEYQRLVDSGELQKYLVDPPARPMALGSRILGFTLIAFGLLLLSLIFIGFTTGLGA
jgi:cytochrome b subunit of formate dehydrogenase